MKPMSDKKAIWWEKQRQKGKWLWIAKSFLMFVVLMSTFNLGVDYFIKILPFENMFLVYVFTGLFVGIFGWWANEAEYKSYLLDQKKKKILNFNYVEHFSHEFHESKISRETTIR